MPYLELGDTSLFYTDAGSGPPLVLVHGYTCDSHDWSWVLPSLRERHRVITYDRRGHGHTADPASGDYTMATQVDDLARVIAHTGAERPVLVGHSLGGALVSHAVIERPQLARAIVVLDPPYAAEAAAAAAADAAKPALAEAASARAAISGMWQAICYTPASPPWLRTMVQLRIEAMSQAALDRDFRAMWDHPDDVARRPGADGYLARRPCPVLAVHSLRELAVYERSLFADQHSRAIDWPGTGHWLAVERPLELVSVVEDWLDTLPA